MRRTVLAVAAAASLAVAALTGPAAQASPSRELASHANRVLGAVLPAHAAGKTSSTTSNLTYHNGPVMTSNTVYAIFIEPPGYTVSTNYNSLIQRYFTDVAAASGTTSNVYDSDTQYYQVLNGVTTKIAYSSSFSAPANVYVDSSKLPANGCKDRYTSVCLSDAQIQTILQNDMAKAGWTGGIGKEFFVFTAKGIGSCAGRSCAFSQYCAYHSWIGSASTSTLYANMPYADTVPAACDAGQHPNGDDADATINVTSHEHNETITDPNGNAWYDSSGYENGDKCAWNFGAVTGPSGAEYNQTINGHNYFLQQEWSNASSGCVLQNT